MGMFDEAEVGTDVSLKGVWGPKTHSFNLIIGQIFWAAVVAAPMGKEWDEYKWAGSPEWVRMYLSLLWNQCLVTGWLFSSMKRGSRREEIWTFLWARKEESDCYGWMGVGKLKIWIKWPFFNWSVLLCLMRKQTVSLSNIWRSKKVGWMAGLNLSQFQRLCGTQKKPG